MNILHKILLVEDDLVIAQSIKTHLEKWGYVLDYVTDFSKVVENTGEYTLVLLDICLPFFNGYHWCTEIRKKSNIPIIFLSSANDKMSIIMAINMGADDFIAKPFDLQLLTTKISALLRRTYNFSTGINVIAHNGLVFNINDATFLFEDKKIELTKNEHRILKTLIENKGCVVSRGGIMEQLWETDSYIDENTLTVNINRLRKKLANAGVCDYIKTKKGEGYIV